jgi:uncharacterized protein
MGERIENMEDSFYVYALKDPRNGRPFYVGKGTGTRAWDHGLRVDKTRKGKRIEEITSKGLDVIVSILAEGLSELQALKLESELVTAFGTEKTGGFLTNTVIPSGKSAKVPRELVIPFGLREKAQLGLAFLKETILELAKANPRGILNSDAVKALGLQSDYKGGSKDYLTWSIIGILMREGRLKRADAKRHVAQVK